MTRLVRILGVAFLSAVVLSMLGMLMFTVAPQRSMVQNPGVVDAASRRQIWLDVCQFDRLLEVLTHPGYAITERSPQLPDAFISMLGSQINPSAPNGNGCPSLLLYSSGFALIPDDQPIPHVAWEWNVIQPNTIQWYNWVASALRSRSLVPPVVFPTPFPPIGIGVPGPGKVIK